MRSMRYVVCAMLLAGLPASASSESPIVFVTGRNDIVVREVFRCLDGAGHERSLTYHLDRGDYGYTLWMITTSLERGNPATDLRLPTNVIYDTRVDGEVERMDVIEQRARDVLSGTRVRIEEPAGTQYWGPYTLLQDLAGERFELEYYEQYTGGRAGRLHLKIGPLETSGGDIGGFVRADGMNLINDSTTRLTACVFNREPVVFTLPVVPDVNVAGE